MLVCQRWEQVNIIIIRLFTTVIITLTIVIVVKRKEGKIC